MKIKSLWEEPPIQTKISIYSKRQWYEPKLSKPKELKEIKHIFSVDWIPKKCACKCFIYGNDLYIQHRDFNSVLMPEHNHEFRQKFIYKDEYGCVVLRGEAWLKLENFILDIQNEVFIFDLVQHLTEQTTEIFGYNEWERFYEEIIKRTKTAIMSEK
jgi:hypothetical protein